jgi:hypothetical protein
MQPPRRDTPTDGSIAQAQLEQLRARDHPVLTDREPRGGSIDGNWCGFRAYAVHFRHQLPRGRFSPPRCRRPQAPAPQQALERDATHKR